MSRNGRIAIFGSGLSAGYILAAVNDLELEADIYTATPLDKVPNLSHVLLREVPPNYKETFQPERVTFFSTGTREAYLARMKRFEDRKSSKTAFPETGRSELYIYNPNNVLSVLLPPSTPYTIAKFSDEEIEEIAGTYEWAFVTFPLQRSIRSDKFVKYWMAQPAGLKSYMPNYAIYNGTNDLMWTRYTCYWGTERWEFSHLEFPAEGPAPMAEGAMLVSDIAPGIKEYVSLIPRLTLVGRFARWNKAVLAHEAYSQAFEILQTL